jgi:hypothetical protein
MTGAGRGTVDAAPNRQTGVAGHRRGRNLRFLERSISGPREVC